MKKVFFLLTACLLLSAMNANAYWTWSISAESYNSSTRSASQVIPSFSPDGMSKYTTYRFSLYHWVYGSGSSSSASVIFTYGGSFYTEISGINGQEKNLGSYVDAKASSVHVSARGNSSGGYGKAKIYW